MNKKTIPGLKIITINRKASFNYFFKEIFEAGIVLKGSEIKSVRSGKINIADSEHQVQIYNSETKVLIQNFETRALSVVGRRSAIGQNPLPLLDLVSPSLWILTGKNNERIAKKLQGADLVVLDIEGFRKRASVDQESLVSLFVGHDAESVARFLDHAGTFPILSTGYLPVRVPHATDDKGELVQHAKLTLQAVEDSYGTLLTKHLL